MVYFDLVGTGIEGYNKFIPYYFHPETTYVVSLSQSAYRTKISVGSNPWAPRPRVHNIAEICERYGLEYTTGPLRKQLASEAKKICRLALPGRRAPEPEPVAEVTPLAA